MIDIELFHARLRAAEAAIHRMIDNYELQQRFANKHVDTFSEMMMQMRGWKLRYYSQPITTPFIILTN